jgi:hypothetical protein
MQMPMERGGFGKFERQPLFGYNARQFKGGMNIRFVPLLYVQF